jgi:aspartate 1-decarboxylase
VQKGDVIIIISYAQMSVEEAQQFQPKIIFPDENTNLLT